RVKMSHGCRHESLSRYGFQHGDRGAMAARGRRARRSAPEYRPDESQKRKHHWDQPYAGFEEGVSGEQIGKCPVTMTIEAAQALLDEAVAYREKARTDDPPYL